MKKYLVVLVLFSSLSQAADKTDILRIFQQFTLSSAAAGKCIKPKPEELTSFLANYQMVTTFAIREVQKRKPTMSKAQAESFLVAGGKRATNAVYKVIAETGCETPKIQRLIDTYHLQARWKP